MKLEIKNVNKSFASGKGKTLPVLENINLTLQEEEFVALVGPSGCGKSTLLNICAGLLSPDSGAVSFTGAEEKREPAISLAQRAGEYRFWAGSRACPAEKGVAGAHCALCRPCRAERL